MPFQSSPSEGMEERSPQGVHAPDVCVRAQGGHATAFCGEERAGIMRVDAWAAQGFCSVPVV